jgi:hypothetical protein
MGFRCDMDLKICVMFDSLIFINSIYLLIDFWLLVTMRGVYKSFSEVCIGLFVNSRCKKVKLSLCLTN